MDMLFIKVLNMSISASWLVLVVLSLRFLLKKSPRWVHVALWALVAVRLICPVSIESVLSLIPSPQTVPESIVYAQRPAIDSGVEVIDWVVNSSMSESLTPQVGASVNPIQVHLFVQENLWCLGMVLMAAWAMVSYLRLKKKVSASLALGNGVYLCDYIDTPFILGIAVPKIYLPSAMEPDDASHVLAHERAHIARKDHWWKPFGYLLLTIHWFNPLLWLAYILLCRDIELACDEKVVHQMTLPERKSYSDALLKCSVRRRHVAACPLAFGEVGVKERVKTVLRYKKPAFWIVLIAILALIVTAVCFLTDPVREENLKAGTYRVEEVVYRNPAISYYMTEEAAPLVQITGDNTLGIREQDEEWGDLGELSEIQLSDLNFDELFFNLQLGPAREENQQAWILAVPPQDARNTTEFYMLWKQSGGLYLAQGMAFTNVYPLHKNILDATLTVTWLYRLTEVGSEQDVTESILESPYAWASTLRAEDLFHCTASLGTGDWSADPLGDEQLRELVALLNQVPEDQFVSKEPEGKYDPHWNFEGVNVHLFAGQDHYILLRYAQDTVMIDADSDSPSWDEDGNWVIENQDLKEWMQNLSYGGSHMLSEKNREEIRQLLQMDYVEFFAPREYEDLLFIGCRWDHDRGLGVACFEKVAYGYKLVRLIRDEDVKQCASGSDLYYCDHNNRRIFLVMNDSVTAMEFAGAYETKYPIDTHPGLVVEYFPPSQASMYRFVYGEGNAATMYMDWNNQTYGQVPDYSVDIFANPDDAYSICSRLKPEQVYITSATEMLEVDDRYFQACSYYLTSQETECLLEMLNTLPEDSFELADYPGRDFRTVDIQFRNFTEMEDRVGGLTLRLHEGAVYYRFFYDWAQPFQTWKIDDAQLTAYLETFFIRDKSTWHRYAPCPKVDGTIRCEVDGAEITTAKMSAFEYEITDMGLRFKPADKESWVELRYLTEPFAGCGTGLKTFQTTYGGRSCTRGIYDENDYWSFLDLTITAGDVGYNIVLLNEDPWVNDYEDEISWILLNLRIQ